MDLKRKPKRASFALEQLVLKSRLNYETSRDNLIRKNKNAICRIGLAKVTNFPDHDTQVRVFLLVFLINNY